MIPGVQSLAKEVSVVPSPLEPRNHFHALTIEEPEEPSDENVTFEEPEEPSEENFACLRSATDSQPIEPSKSNSQPIEPSKSDSQPIEPQPIDSQPIEPSKSDSQPIETSKSDSQPIEPSKSDSQPIEPQPIDSQPVEPSKSEVIYSGKSDSLSLNPGTSTMNSETGNGTSVAVPGSPEISNLSDSSNCSSDLLRFKGSLSGQDALVLIDCGSTHDFVSSGFVEKSNLETQTTNKNFSVTMADGRTCSQPRMITAPVTLELNDFQSTQAFTVFPLDKYDVILGKPWLAVHNPLIDFQTNYIQKRLDKNEPLKESPSGSVTSSSNEASNIELNFISGCQARHALRSGDEGFVAWVSEASKTSDNDWSQLNIQVEGHHCREMNNLLRNFGGSFPKELPRNLPPNRTVNHGIDLEPGHSPQSKPPYRLSQPHLDELQTQLSALLERGFIEPSKSPFGAPVFFVRKSDGSLRLVCD